MFDAYISIHACLRPAATAIIAPWRRISFAELDNAVSRAAAMLRPLAAGRDGPVAVDVTDNYLHWLTTLALARLGLASAPGADAACLRRVSDRGETGPDIVIGHREIQANSSEGLSSREGWRQSGDGIGRVMLSSGTTGAAKRIALSWAVIDAGIRNVPLAYGVAPGPWLMVNPPTANLPFILTLGCWALGLPVLMLDGPLQPPRLQASRPGLMAMLPGQLADLLDTLPAGFPRWPLRVVTAGAAVPPRLLARTRQRLTDDLVSIYGASECGAVAVATSALLDQVPDAAGVVLPDATVQIVDISGALASTGKLGHVRIAGERCAAGYLRGPAGAFRDGWFWPGDLGRLDADGLLHIEGRTDDLMNIGGEKVLPAWIEAVARDVPGVRDVAACAVRRDDGVERCCLAIVPGDGFDETALAAALAPAAAALGGIDWLRIDRLPRTPIGKLDRSRLRDEATAFLRTQRAEPA